MLRRSLAVLLALFASVVAHGHPSNYDTAPRCVIANLASGGCGSYSSARAWVVDPTSASDCTVGGGSAAPHECILGEDGVWRSPASGGAVAASTLVDDIASCGPSTFFGRNAGDSAWVCSAAPGGLPPDATYADIVVSGTGTLWNVGANAVALTTDTTGNYVNSVGPAYSVIEGAAPFTDGFASSGTDMFIFEGSGADTAELIIKAGASNFLNDVTITMPGANGAGAPFVGTLVSTGDTASVNETMMAAASVGTSELINNSIAEVDLLESTGTPTDGQCLLYNSGTSAFRWGACGGGGVSDGDKGDITVSGSGATWTIDDSVTVTGWNLGDSLGTSLALGTTPATAGQLRLPNNAATAIAFRNAANSSNLSIYLDSSDLFQIGSGFVASGVASTLSYLQSTNLAPTLYLTDSSFGDSSAFFANCAADDNCSYGLFGPSGAAARVGMITVETSGGNSVGYLGGGTNAETGDTTDFSPANAVTFTEAGVMTAIGTGSINANTVTSGTAPATDAAGEVAFDSNALGTRGAFQIYDGTASTFAVATTDAPTDGQVPVFNDSTDTVTWETPAASSSASCIVLGASEINCFATAGCTGETITGTGHTFTTANFATDADDTGSFSFDVPPGFTGTTATVTIDWMGDHADCDGTATTDDVRWAFDSGSAGDTEEWKAITLGGTANTMDSTCNGPGDLNRQTRTAYVHGFTDEERGSFVLTRDVDADLYTQDAKLLKVKICPE